MSVRSMTKIVLDSEAFKALASDTRLEILKALDVRRLTVSELGRLLDLNKATVFEHLKQLTAADLVKKEDEGRKWVYYRLTWKGKNIVHPENAQIFLMLGGAALGVAGAVATLGRALEWWGLGLGAGDESASENPVPSDAADQAPQAAGSTEKMPLRDDSGSAPAEPAGEGGLLADPALWIAVSLALVVAAVVVFMVFMYRQRLAERREIRAKIVAKGIEKSPS
jgi:DNA-binding transcriptional ArsR family regulator